MSSVFLDHSILYTNVGRIFYLNLKLTDLPCLASKLTPGSSVFTLQALGLQAGCHANPGFLWILGKSTWASQRTLHLQNQLPSAGWILRSCLSTCYPFDLDSGFNVKQEVIVLQQLSLAGFLMLTPSASCLIFLSWGPLVANTTIGISGVLDFSYFAANCSTSFWALIHYTKTIVEYDS